MYRCRKREEKKIDRLKQVSKHENGGERSVLKDEYACVCGVCACVRVFVCVRACVWGLIVIRA